jgi:hypothetical protein
MRSFLRTLRNLFSTKSTTKRRPEDLRARLQLEALEEREVMSVTFHGGAVLPNVAVQGIYYGSDWGNDPNLFNQTGALESYLGSIVNSPYMDMLTNAGYGVGRGHADAGRIVNANPDKTQWLTDSQIQSDLLAEINAPGSGFQQPDGNRLYVVFVEPNVAVLNDHYKNQTSQTNFYGYHSNFTGNVGGSGRTIRYAVIAYPGGWYNLSISWLSTFEQMTEVTSQEIAEAVTDPDVSSSNTLGWYDDNFVNSDGTKGAEVGDIANLSVVYVNGYAVQRIADQGDQAMTPANAAPRNAVTFVLTTGGDLYERTGGGLLYLASGISSISDQGIDNQGRAMIDCITTAYGVAYEFHDGGTWTYLTGGARSAKAGQGESFVLYTDNTMREYKDKDGSWWYLDSQVLAIDAGTDRHGVNAVVELYIRDYNSFNPWQPSGEAWEWSDSTGWNHIANRVTQASAGRQGVVDLVFTDATAYWWQAYAGGVQGGSLVYIGSGVTMVTTGYDQNGNYIIDMLYSNGVVYEYRNGSGWNFLDYNVRSMSKSRGGVIDTNSFADNAWEFDNYGNYTLVLAGIQAVA